MSLIARVAVPGWQGGRGQCLRRAAPVLLNHIGGGRGARCGVRGPSCPTSALTGARLVISHFRCLELPPRQPHMGLGVDQGPACRLGSVPCGVMLTSLSPFKPVPRGMEPSTRRVCRERDVNRCSLQDLCVVSDLTFMSLFFFLEKGLSFHLARISRNICFCPCVEVRNEPKPPPTSPHWQDSPSGISFPFVTV